MWGADDWSELTWDAGDYGIVLWPGAERLVRSRWRWAPQWVIQAVIPGGVILVCFLPSFCLSCLPWETFSVKVSPVTFEMFYSLLSLLQVNDADVKMKSRDYLRHARTCKVVQRRLLADSKLRSKPWEKSVKAQNTEVGWIVRRGHQSVQHHSFSVTEGC